MIATPTAPDDRNSTLDALHGLALFGVILADLPLYGSPLLRELGIAPAGPRSVLDAMARTAVILFAQTKFLTIFSILFGVSLAMLERRAQKSGQPFLGPYHRRLAALFALGLVHTVFVWHSVLLLYVPCAWIAARLQRLSSEKILRVSIVCLVLGAIAPAFAGGLPHPWLEGAARSAFALSRQEATIFAAGTWIDVATLRLSEFIALYAPLALGLFGLRTLAMMLLGVYLFRAGFFDETGGARDRLRAAFRCGLAFGVPLQALSILAPRWMGGAFAPAAMAARWLCAYFGGFALAFGYIGGIALLGLRRPPRAAHRVLATIGRASLSGYLLASLAAALVFYPFGFGLYGRIGSAECAAIALILFSALVVLGAFWLARFKFGPFEWLVRAASYGRFPSMRLDPRADP